ncbi:hypothetical protein V5O48_013439 [Marasmius crinis-equi]|uniref:Uncharacterized protein n=1 Tax=Marasmius crinis-equi TaxID=585013 RepID=A0ABR3F029_9AGAR
MAGYGTTGSVWNLDAVLSAMNMITTVAPEPAPCPCEPKVFDNNEDELTLRPPGDMICQKHSGSGYCTGPYDLYRAKEVFQNYCLEYHKGLADPVHHQLREDAAQRALNLADSARGRLLQQELRILFPGMYNNGDQLPKLEDNPNFLKGPMLHKETLGGELVKFPSNAEFRSAEGLGNWALFVVSGEGVEKYASLQPAIVSARRKVEAGPVTIIFTSWAVNAQKVFGMLTGEFSREKEEVGMLERTEDVSVSFISLRDVSGMVVAAEEFGFNDSLRIPTPDQ